MPEQLTDKEKVLFDLKGFLLFPAVLASLPPERRRFFNEVYHPQFDRMQLV